MIETMRRGTPGVGRLKSSLLLTLMNSEQESRVDLTLGLTFPALSLVRHRATRLSMSA